MRIRSTYKTMQEAAKLIAPNHVFSDYTEVEKAPKGKGWEYEIVEYDDFDDVAFPLAFFTVDGRDSRPVENATFGDIFAIFAGLQTRALDEHHICYEGWKVEGNVGPVTIVSLYSGS